MGTEHKVKRTESKNVRKFYKAGVERVVREIRSSVRGRERFKGVGVVWPMAQESFKKGSPTMEMPSGTRGRLLKEQCLWKTDSRSQDALG